jgi:hypothetical protein
VLRSAFRIVPPCSATSRTRAPRYRTALGSARETGACLDVALAFGYVEQVQPELLGKLDQVRVSLAKVVM